jgi:hypothetical protein
MSSVNTPGNPLETAATWKARGIALLRLFAFLGIAMGLTAVAILLVVHGLKIKIELDAGLNAQTLLIAEALQAVAMVVIPAAIMIRLAREPAAYFGW